MHHNTAFIFDMDGTIINSMPYHVHSWLVAFNEIGLPISAEELHRNDRGNVHQVVRRIVGHKMSTGDIQTFAERKEILYRQAFRPHLKLLNGLADFFKTSKHLGILLGLATNAGWVNIDYVLDGLDIRSFFSVVVSGEDVERGKPDPELFLMAANGLNIAPEKCIVFEDSISGIEAAEKAGMSTVVVNSSSQPALRIGRPSVIKEIEDYTSLHPIDLIKMTGHLQVN